MYTAGITQMLKLIEERGPRYCIQGTIRRGEFYVLYADNAERAESWRDTFKGRGYYQIEIHAPEGSVDLAKLGNDRADAKRKFDEATAILKAGVLRGAEEGRAEAEMARQAGVDRMTIRDWVGK